MHHLPGQTTLIRIRAKFIEAWVTEMCRIKAKECFFWSELKCQLPLTECVCVCVCVCVCACVCVCTRVGTLIVATIYLQLIQNRYMFRSFTVLHCSHQHCVQPVARKS